MQFYLWSASSPCKTSKLKAGLRGLKNLNIEYKFAAGVKAYVTKKQSASHSFLAGTSVKKVTALKSLLRSNQVTNILTIRGGYGALQLLPLLDKIKIRPKNKKMIWGYSDTTAIQIYFYNRYNWPWVHSPMLCSAAFTKIKSIDHLTFKKNLNARKIKLKKLSTTVAWPAKTKFLGGNLSVLCALMGTPWELKSKGTFVLVLEDINETPGRLNRMLTQLASAKFMKNCRGVLLGHFTLCPKHREIFKTWASDNKLCVVTGLAVGHQSPNTPLPMGVNVLFSKGRTAKDLTLHLPAISFR